jgi:hypothetical protein
VCCSGDTMGHEHIRPNDSLLVLVQEQEELEVDKLLKSLIQCLFAKSMVSVVVCCLIAYEVAN